MGFFENKFLAWSLGPKNSLQQLVQEKEILHGGEVGKEERGEGCQRSKKLVLKC